MRRLIDRCAGIDVGQALWVVRVRRGRFEDPGAGVVRKTSEEQQRRRAIRQLEALGLTVTVQTRKETDAA